MTGCLHLKSAVTQVGENSVVLNPAWIDPGLFAGMTIFEVDAEEPHAANAVLIGETVLMPAQYPKTIKRLRGHGLAVETVDVSELVKAEGAVTCCSLIFDY